jgi:hypothetical protein
MRTRAALLILLISAVPAWAQCFVGQPGLSYEQWFGICRAAVMQTCGAVPGGAANCQAIAAAMYQTYWASQYARPSSCTGGQMCINGWVSECVGGQWMTTAGRC